LEKEPGEAILVIEKVIYWLASEKIAGESSLRAAYSVDKNQTCTIHTLIFSKGAGLLPGAQYTPLGFNKNDCLSKVCHI